MFNAFTVYAASMIMRMSVRQLIMGALIPIADIPIIQLLHLAGKSHFSLRLNEFGSRWSQN